MKLTKEQVGQALDALGFGKENNPKQDDFTKKAETRARAPGSPVCYIAIFSRHFSANRRGKLTSASKPRLSKLSAICV